MSIDHIIVYSLISLSGIRLLSIFAEWVKLGFIFTKSPFLTSIVNFAKAVIPVLLIVFVVRGFFFEIYKVPSKSMLPTLQVSDYILLHKSAYSAKVPVFDYKLFSTGDIEKGDVIAFKYPLDEKFNYVKRVYGLPGDNITYKDKQLFINDEKIKEEPLNTIDQDEFFMAFINTHTFQIQKSTQHKNTKSEGSWLVPKDAYFVMGDNRDGSSDSRFWGFVPKEKVFGKIIINISDYFR